MKTQIKALAVLVSTVAILYGPNLSAQTAPTVTSNPSGDVYNFYFQKAPGPQTVIQSGAQQQQQQTPVTTASAPVTDANLADFKHWSISFGGGFANYEYGSTNIPYYGVGAVIEYRLHPYLGLFGFLDYAKDTKKEISTGGNTVVPSDKPTRKNPIDSGLGVALMPLNLKAFDMNLLEVGAIGGITTYVKVRPYPFYDDDSVTVNKGIKAFIGPRLAINITETIGILMETRFILGTNASSTSHIGMRMRF